jgi:hypothetical protein
VRHWVLLGISLLVIFAAFGLEFGQSDGLRLPGSDARLPTVCASRLLFGVECPGCGLTRSFVALAAGDFAESFRFNRIGWLIAFAVLLQIPYRIFALRELRGGVVVERPWLAWLGYFLLAALILNWVLRLIGL